MKRGLLIGGVAVVVIVAGAIAVLYSSLDSIVKAAVEDVGSRATKTQVTLESAKISPTSGEGSLRGFRMGNPPGFQTESAMRFGEVSVKLDVGSVTGDTILIREVVIGAPQITYELNSGGGSNIAAIQKNVEAFTASMGGGKAEPAKPAEGGKKVIIENLYVRDGKIAVSAAMLAGKTMNAPLPTIHLRDIGKDKGGATPAEVADRLLTAISRSAQNSVGSLGLDKMMKEGTAGARRAIESGAGDARKKVEEGTKGAGDALKGLLGR